MRRVLCWNLAGVDGGNNECKYVVSCIPNHTRYQTPEGAESPVFLDLETKVRACSRGTNPQ
jgi:hypothetical protein